MEQYLNPFSGVSWRSVQGRRLQQGEQETLKTNLLDRFSDHPMIKTDPPYWAGEGFANRATALIDASLLEPSIPNLQFWGIMACVEYGRASGSRLVCDMIYNYRKIPKQIAGRAWIYGGIAARICQDLGLNKEETLRLPIHRKDDSVDTVAMALRRRIFWSCICIDK